MGFTKAFFIEDPQENRLAEFKWHVSMHMKLDVTFKNTAQDGQEVTLLVRPDEVGSYTFIAGNGTDRLTEQTPQET